LAHNVSVPAVINGNLDGFFSTQGMRFRDKLLWYTIAPMIISVLLVIPTIVVLVLGKMSREGAWTSHPKYKDVTANYFWAQSFFMFLIYPTGMALKSFMAGRSQHLKSTPTLFRLVVSAL